MKEIEFVQRVVPLRDRMFRYARMLLLSDEDARDTVYDLLEHLWRHRDALDSQRNIASFVLTSVRNRCYDSLRQRYAQRRRDETATLLSERTTTRAIEEWEARDLIRHAMDALPHRQREILYLKEIEGTPISEIAEATAADEAVVRVLLSRARRKLREEIEKILNDERIRKTD